MRLRPILSVLCGGLALLGLLLTVNFVWTEPGRRQTSPPASQAPPLTDGESTDGAGTDFILFGEQPERRPHREQEELTMSRFDFAVALAHCLHSSLLAQTDVTRLVVAPNGRAYALKTNGDLMVSDDGRASPSRLIAHDVISFAVSPRGVVYQLNAKGGGVLLNGWGTPGNFQQIGPGNTRSFAMAPNGTIYALGADSVLRFNTAAGGNCVNVLAKNVISFAVTPRDVVYQFIIREVPFEEIRTLLPKDGEPITLWKGRVAWPRDKRPEQRQEYGEIAFGRLIRSHPNDRNDRDQAWLRPGIIARDGYLEIRAGWRAKIDHRIPLESPHYDGLVRAKLRITVVKGKLEASLDDVNVRHRGDSWARRFGVDLGKIAKAIIETKSTKLVAALNDEFNKLPTKLPALQMVRERISVDIIGAPPLQPPKGFAKLLFDAGIYDRPDARLGMVRISMQARTRFR